MTKKQFLAYHRKIVRTKNRDEIADIIAQLFDEEHSEPKDALFQLAMANKRIFYNLDWFDAADARKK